jgi:hypothetical protein
MSFEIVPCVYDRKTGDGNFKDMINGGEYDDALFLYNENCQDMYDLDDDTPGAGTAVIRPYSWLYNNDKPLQVLGIPTGVSSALRGFKVLNQDTKQAIKLSFQRIIVLVRRSPHIKRIIYSADSNDTTLLGTSVFSVDEKVLRFISRSIWKLPEILVNEEYSPLSLEEIRVKELELMVGFLKEDTLNLRSQVALLKKRPLSSVYDPRDSGDITSFLFKRCKK